MFLAFFNETIFVMVRKYIEFMGKPSPTTTYKLTKWQKMIKSCISMSKNFLNAILVIRFNICNLESNLYLLTFKFSQKTNEWICFVFYREDSEILETWISISSFKYFWVIRIEKQIHLFVFWEKLQLDNFV